MEHTTLALLLLVIAVIAWLVILVVRRSDETADNVDALHKSLTNHAAKIWRAIEELRRRRDNN